MMTSNLRDNKGRQIQVGDIVRVAVHRMHVGAPRGKDIQGVVRESDPDHVGVEFLTNVGGHDLQGTAKDYCCWNFFKDGDLVTVRPVPEPEVVVRPGDLVYWCENPERRFMVITHSTYRMRPDFPDLKADDVPFVTEPGAIDSGPIWGCYVKNATGEFVRVTRYADRGEQ